MCNYYVLILLLKILKFEASHLVRLATNKEPVAITSNDHLY